MVCKVCAGTGRYFYTRVTERGNVVITSYGRCPDCQVKAMNVQEFAHLKVGDEVKIRYGGLVSEDWQTITEFGGGGMQLDGSAFAFRWVDAIIDHQPAPRKVEVTLPSGLKPGQSMFYGNTYEQRVVTLIACTEPDFVNFKIRDLPDVATLRGSAARELALDILATVGVEP